MWVVAGILLGLVVLVGLVGFHSGPHVHVGATVLGILAAVWLLIMVAEGRSMPVLWALLGADLALSAGMGVLAYFGIRHTVAPPHPPLGRLEGAEGVAVSALNPDGIVRVGGEEWSAVSVNGPVPAGSPVQVIRAGGVRIEVWGEHPLGQPVPPGESSPRRELGPLGGGPSAGAEEKERQS